MRCLLSYLVAVAVVESTAGLEPPSVWPQPRSVTFGARRGTISDAFRILVNEESGPDPAPWAWWLPKTLSTATWSGAKRAQGGQDIVSAAVGRYSKLCLRPSSLARGTKGDHELKVLRISVPSLQRNPELATASEHYNLTVSFPAATLYADSGVGVLRGLETFCQLIQGGSVLQATIVDYPRFSFRGVLIDTSRHFLPLDLIREHIDAMQYNKMNILQWHIVDDQSFPYESQVFPLLSRGAWSQEEKYTIQDIKDIVEFARLRGVRVVPEFDTPGHTQSWGIGYPELRTQCADGSTGPLRADLPGTYHFLNKLFQEVAEVFPDPFVHLGGDEVNFDCWVSNKEVSKFLNSSGLDAAGLENLYEQRLLAIVGDLGKSYIVWQEIFNNAVKVKPDTIIDVWKGFDAVTLQQATMANLSVVLSGGWYLDHLDNDAWAFYSQEPTSFPGGDEAERLGRLLGGKACMWGEHVDSSNFIPRVWPRASAVAERLWSSKDVVNPTTAAPRLAEFRCRLLARGIGAEPLAPGSCRETNPFHYAPPYADETAPAEELFL